MTNYQIEKADNTVIIFYAEDCNMIIGDYLLIGF